MSEDRAALEAAVRKLADEWRAEAGTASYERNVDEGSYRIGRSDRARADARALFSLLRERPTPQSESLEARLEALERQIEGAETVVRKWAAEESRVSYRGDLKAIAGELRMYSVQIAALLREHRQQEQPSVDRGNRSPDGDGPGSVEHI